jgi:monofunctional glycosyltransferase
MTTRDFLRKLWRISRKVFIILFVAQLAYIILLKWINPPITMTQMVSWVSGHGLKRDYVKRSSMSPYARLAVISSEDQLFPHHSGFDWKSIKKAREYNEKQEEKHSSKRRGGSTISQQVAKNVFLWQGGGIFRKGLEVYFTFMIEKIWGKKRILEVYLNVIEMGDGIFGIEAAAQSYFNKPAKNLTRQEAAMIAACLPNPKRYKVKPPSSHVLFRSRSILRQMNNLETDVDVQRITGVADSGKQK